MDGVMSAIHTHLFEFVILPGVAVFLLAFVKAQSRHIETESFEWRDLEVGFDLVIASIVSLGLYGMALDKLQGAHHPPPTQSAGEVKGEDKPHPEAQGSST